MDEEDREKAWRQYSDQLEALGVDPYLPDVPLDHPHHAQVQAIIAEHDAALGKAVTPPLPTSWEGTPPLDAIRDLADMAGWLKDQWHSVLAMEMGGERYRDAARDQAARAIRNAFRLLEWLGVEERPERPMPPFTLEAAKAQIDDLERWVRRKNKGGWRPSERPDRPTAVLVPPQPKPEPGIPSVVLNGPGRPPTVLGKEKPVLTTARYNVITALLNAGMNGLTKDELDKKSGHTEARKILGTLAESDPDWNQVISMAGGTGRGYRIL